MIRTLQQMEEKVLALKKKHRIAIAWAQDANTIGALGKVVRKCFIEAIEIGNTSEIKNVCRSEGIDEKSVSLVESDNEEEASRESVSLAKKGEADIVMKGLVGTDKFLRAEMDKEKGIMLPSAVLSYVCA